MLSPDLLITATLVLIAIVYCLWHFLPRIAVFRKKPGQDAKNKARIIPLTPIDKAD